jgi:putative DNA primase/helicase
MMIMEAFKQSMQKSGIESPAEIIPDGVLHRFTVSGDKALSENGWYVLYADEPAAGAFGCWKRGISETWSSTPLQTMSQVEKAAFTAKMDVLKRQREDERERIQTECRTWCAETWNKAKDATNVNPYLTRKGVNAYGLKCFKDTLIVPVQDMAGVIHGIQFIMPDGTKKFKTGTKKAGHFFKIGKTKEKTVIVCEGYGTGASIYQATGHAVVIAFDSGNLLAVAKNIREKYHAMKIIIAADDDQWTDGNPGITKATEAARAVGGLLAHPVFPDTTTKPTDFNDLHSLLGLDQVRLQIEAAATATKRTNQSAADATPLAVEYRRMSDVASKPIKWLWQGRFARGKVSMLAGHPGLGKSQIISSIAAIVTTGGLWPVDRTRCEPGNVIILSAEDDAADTIRPRLDAAGADAQRVYILDAVIDKTGGRRSFNLAVDLERLEQMIVKIGGVALISIDPITAYLGGTDSHKNADIRALLSPLAELAAKHNAAIICVSHLNKGGGGEAMTRITGSLAFVAAARAAYLIVKDTDDGRRRLFLPVKNNVGNDSSGLAFTIESKQLPEGIETSAVLWEADPVTVTADEAMQPQGDPEGQSALDDAKDFLYDILKDGPLTSKQVRADAEGAGHSWRTVYRAQKAIGIEVSKVGMKGPWMWQLSTKNAKDHEECQANNVATFGDLGILRQTSGPIPSFTEEDFPNLEAL